MVAGNSRGHWKNINFRKSPEKLKAACKLIIPLTGRPPRMLWDWWCPSPPTTKPKLGEPRPPARPGRSEIE